jgi:hypothetical protein
MYRNTAEPETAEHETLDGRSINQNQAAVLTALLQIPALLPDNRPPMKVENGGTAEPKVLEGGVRGAGTGGLPPHPRDRDGPAGDHLLPL